MFWTDSEQARQRLRGSYVLYDGEPYFFTDIDRNHVDGIVAIGTLKGKLKNISLEDKKWNNFRDLPKVGWANLFNKNKSIQASFIERIPTVTRTHGLSPTNCSLSAIYDESLQRDMNNSLETFFNNEGYLETLKDDKAFPLASEIVMNIQKEQTLAFSSLYAIHKDSSGIRWLWRKKEKVGLFIGANTLSLFENRSFLKEEILSQPCFDIEDIKEF